MVEPRVDEAGFPRVAEPDEFYSREAAVISGEGLVAEVARTKNSRPLVQRTGGEGLSAHHDWHAGGSGGIGQGGAENFSAPAGCAIKPFLCGTHRFLLKAKGVFGVLWIKTIAVRHHAEPALSFPQHQTS